MKKTLFTAFALPLVTALVSGCAAKDNDTPGNQAGSAGVSGSAGTGGSAGNGGSAGSAGDSPVIDPSLFDCTHTDDPVRVNPTPTSCATDTACTTTLIAGHRGAGGQLGVIAPEDTVAAVRAAILLGIDFVETDPRPTKDGFLVNLHDTDVSRTTHGTGVADQMTLAEIQALTLKTSSTPGDFSCERIPTLEQILAAARGNIHVLVDANKTDRVDLLVAAIQSTDTVDWAIFDTSSIDKIDAALAIEPKLHTMIRISSTADLDAQLSHFSGHPPVIVEIESTGDRKVLIPAIHAAHQRAFTDVFVSDLSVGLTQDTTLYQTFVNDGLDILQTDRPDLVLQSLGRWPPPAQP